MYFHFHLLFDICAVLALAASPPPSPSSPISLQRRRANSKIVFRMSYTLQLLHFTMKRYGNEQPKYPNAEHLTPAKRRKSDTERKRNQDTTDPHRLQLQLLRPANQHFKLKLFGLCVCVFFRSFSVSVFCHQLCHVYFLWACKWNTILTRQFTWVLALICTDRKQAEAKRARRSRATAQGASTAQSDTQNGKLKHFMSKVEIAIYLEQIFLHNLFLSPSLHQIGISRLVVLCSA